jgi:hypothetical protein
MPTLPSREAIPLPEAQLTVSGGAAFGVHPLGCLWPENTLKGGHQTEAPPKP